jgi:hypothetical protein
MKEFLDGGDTEGGTIRVRRVLTNAGFLDGTVS